MLKVTKDSTEEEIKAYFKEREDFTNKRSMICPLCIAIIWLISILFIATDLTGTVETWVVFYSLFMMFLMPLSILYPGFWLTQKLLKRKEKQDERRN